MGDLVLHSAMYARLETKKIHGFSPGTTGVHGCHYPRDMAVRTRAVMARLWVGVCVPLAFTGSSWSTFPAHVEVELLCGSQPTAPTCVLWNWRLIDCFPHTPAVRGFFRRGFSSSLLINPTALTCCMMGPNKGETAVCGCHCPRDMAEHMRGVLVWPWVGVCVPLASTLHYFNAIELS